MGQGTGLQQEPTQYCHLFEPCLFNHSTTSIQGEQMCPNLLQPNELNPSARLPNHEPTGPGLVHFTTQESHSHKCTLPSTTYGLHKEPILKRSDSKIGSIVRYQVELLDRVNSLLLCLDSPHNKPDSSILHVILQFKQHNVHFYRAVHTLSPNCERLNMDYPLVHWYLAVWTLMTVISVAV